MQLFLLINAIFFAIPLIVIFIYTVWNEYYVIKISKTQIIYFDKNIVKLFEYCKKIKKFYFAIYLIVLGMIFNALDYCIGLYHFKDNKEIANFFYISYILIAIVFISYLLFFFKVFLIENRKKYLNFNINLKSLHNVIILENIEIKKINSLFFVNNKLKFLTLILKSKCGLEDNKQIVYSAFKLIEYAILLMNNNYLNKLNSEDKFFFSKATNTYISKKEYADMLNQFLNSTIIFQ